MLIRNAHWSTFVIIKVEDTKMSKKVEIVHYGQVIPSSIMEPLKHFYRKY